MMVRNQDGDSKRLLFFKSLNYDDDRNNGSKIDDDDMMVHNGKRDSPGSLIKSGIPAQVMSGKIINV